MRLTILGKSPAWQDADGACSGYLVDAADTTVLLDCGNGVFSKLRARHDYTEVDAVVLSHLHADHFLDLVPYSYALTLSPRQQREPVGRWPGTDDPARPRLIGPPGTRETLRRVVGAWGDGDLIEDAFEIEEYEPGGAVEIGPLRASFHHVPHYVPAYAVDFSAGDGGGRFTFGADCGPSDELVETARDTGLLLVEATLALPEDRPDRGHMTAREAGERARMAGAERVVLTHISDELEADVARREAAEGFGAPVEVAREGVSYEM